MTETAFHLEASRIENVEDILEKHTNTELIDKLEPSGVCVWLRAIVKSAKFMRESACKRSEEVKHLKGVVTDQLLSYAKDQQKLKELQSLKAFLNDEEVWYWGVDPEFDVPEEISCPIVMQPADLHKILRKIEVLEAEKEAVMELLRPWEPAKR